MNFTPWKGPMLEQILKHCSLWKRPTFEQFMNDCVQWEGPHDGAGEKFEVEGVADTKCYELTATTIPHLPALLRGRR